GGDLKRRTEDLALLETLAAGNGFFLGEVDQPRAMQGLLRHLDVVDGCRTVRADGVGERRDGALERRQSRVRVAERSDLDDPAADRRRAERRCRGRGGWRNGRWWRNGSWGCESGYRGDPQGLRR